MHRVQVVLCTSPDNVVWCFESLEAPWSGWCAIFRSAILLPLKEGIVYDEVGTEDVKRSLAVVASDCV